MVTDGFIEERNEFEFPAKTIFFLISQPWMLQQNSTSNLIGQTILKEIDITHCVLIDSCRFKVNLGCHHFRFNQYFFWVSNHWFWNGKNWPGSNLRFFRVHYAIVLKRQLWTWENIWFDQTRTFSRFKTNLELKIPDFWFTLNRQMSGSL